MEKLEKPKLLQIDIFEKVMFWCSFFQFFIPENILKFKWKLFIFLSLLVIFCIITIIKYCYNNNKFYKKYEEQFDEYNNLYKYNEKLKKNYNQLLENNKVIPVWLEDIIKKLELAVTVPTLEEINYIKKVIHLLNLDKIIYNERKIENEKE